MENTEIVLEEYCEHVKKFRSNIGTFILNKHYKIIYINQKMQEYWNKLSIMSMSGMSLWDTYQAGAPFLEQRRKMYEYVIKTKQATGCFITLYAEESKTYLVTRVLLNPIIYQDEIYGIDVTSAAIDSLPIINDPHKEHLFAKENLPSLTTREWEIMLLKYLGKTDKEISLIIAETQGKTISEKTVNNIILQQIYPKLNVASKSELLEKINTFGINLFFPRSFLIKNNLIMFTEYQDVN